MDIETVIIADDFTGAGDSSINFCHAGYSVFLPLRVREGDLNIHPDVLAINTETRLADESEAAERVRLAANKCRELGVTSFYKKIDSTLRGNIEAEVTALMETAEYQTALICPASPDLGRTVIDGRCLIYGKPINKTESGKDHLNPVKSAFIKDLFKSADSGSTYQFSIGEIEKGRGYFRARVNELMESGVRYILCDAENQDHLKVIASLYSDRRVLLVGSSGLAAAITASMGTPVHRDDSGVFDSGQILILSGSRMDVSRKQIKYLAEKRDFNIMPVPVAEILDKNTAAIDRFFMNLETMDTEKPMILVAGDHDRVESADKVKDNSEIIADLLAESAIRVCRQRDISVLIIIGGHTTYKTLNKIDTQGVLYQGEIIPGTPYGRLIHGDPDQSLSLVTKSGSFGDENALVEIVDFVRQRMQEKGE